MVVTDDFLWDHYSGILSLEDNWDGEGSKGYTVATVRRAYEFAQRIYEITGHRLFNSLEAGPYGAVSIDHSFNDGYELLVDIHADEDQLIDFFGDDGQFDNEIHGMNYPTEQQRSEALIDWLYQRPLDEDDYE